MEFRLPPLGEGIDSAVVVTISAEVGRSVSPGQELFVVETDKSSMPITAETAGTIESIQVKANDRVSVGQVILTMTPSAAVPAPPPTAKPSAPSSPPPPPVSAPAPVAEAAPTKIDFTLQNLGQGIDGGTITTIYVQPSAAIQAGQPLFGIETDKAAITIEAPAGATKVEEICVAQGEHVKVGQLLAVLTMVGSAAPSKAAPAAKPMPNNGRLAPSPTAVPVAVAAPPEPVAATAAPATPAHLPVPAGPATRRLARELGVDLRSIRGTARGGRVTIDDVKTFVKQRLSAPPPVAAPTGLPAAPPLPDFSKWGAIEKKPLTNIRKTIAANMMRTWNQVPMVTQFDNADITELEAGRKRIVDGQPKGTPKITMTILAIKAVVACLKQFPQFNSSLDLDNGELIAKKYYHIGIAVDTERGLVVPVIRDADKKSIHDLAKEVAEVADKARANKLTIDEMRGGTFTISNLGGIGGTAFSPIVNWPEVAILGIARSSLQPVVRDGKIEVRLLMPLCLTYDHRVIDGADGARFTTRLSAILSDPIRLLMES